ncbi:hypothetical protein B0J11DRAFT_318799 [Dendryphion nanum]|uniref:T6SS Phospholipase effector Tle1-like catalytic domain-containing protein n=1 Tax=Dendryphion nanum TaxID=256645 RepID=A0A9P9DQT0_9PLEO|nr:hypothetical protein B0J11DRAFT_318799 [Dendryphion nanum]
MSSVPLTGDDKPWHRRIVICCDGTWQSSVALKENVPSNVTKLCRHIARIGIDKDDPTKKFHQLVYYDSGIGTGNLSSSERKRQGGLGAGLAENVIEAYNFIVLNYQPGDEVFCFGFSRGAYTARAVAGLVTDIGVISPVDMQFFPEIYRAYMQNEEGDTFIETDAWKDFLNGPLSHKRQEPLRGDAKKLAQSWGAHSHSDLAVAPESRKVKIVGVFDTVGSLGVPDVAFVNNANFRTKYGFHNVKLNENIEHAFHALALDEKRKAFRPTLWYIDNDLIKSGKPIPELKQVWFPGVHINSGGGADDAISDMKGDLEHLSVASFCWMLQCISPYLTIDQSAFHASTAQYLRWLSTIRTSCTYYHDNWMDWAKKKLPDIPFLGSEEDHLEPPKRSKPHPHTEFDYGWGTGPIVDSYSGMYKLAGAYLRVPGHCEAEIYDPKSDEHKLTEISLHGRTNEYIHPICHYRDLIRGPEPQSALKDFERKFVAEAGGKGRFWWLKKGDKEERRLPEWVILKDRDDTVNFERFWYGKTEKGEGVLGKLKGKGYERDWLDMMDEKVDFTVGAKKGWVYP